MRWWVTISIIEISLGVASSNWRVFHRQRLHQQLSDVAPSGIFSSLLWQLVIQGLQLHSDFLVSVSLAARTNAIDPSLVGLQLPVAVVAVPPVDSSPQSLDIAVQLLQDCLKHDSVVRIAHPNSFVTIQSPFSCKPLQDANEGGISIIDNNLVASFEAPFLDGS